MDDLAVSLGFLQKKVSDKNPLGSIYLEALECGDGEWRRGAKEWVFIAGWMFRSLDLQFWDKLYGAYCSDFHVLPSGKLTVGPCQIVVGRLFSIKNR